MGFNQWFRKHQKVFYVVLGVIIMVTWYMASSIQGWLEARVQQKKVGGIYGRSVSPAEVENTAHFIRAVLARENETPNEAEARAWEHLILMEEARRMGLQASDDEVAKVLALQFPSGAGEFDPAAYRARLRAYQIPADKYETTLKQRMEVQKLYGLVRSAVKISDDEAWRRHTFNNQQVQVKYGELMADKLTELVSLTEEEAKDFHQKRMNVFPEDDPYRAGYKIDEKVKIGYLLAPQENFTKDVIITDEQVRKYYEDNKQRYMEPPRPEAPKKPEEAAASREAEKKEAPAYVSLEKVRASIEALLRRQEARALATAEIDKVSQLIAEETSTPFGSTERKTVDLNEIAGRFRVEHGVTDYFTRDDIPDALIAATKLRTEAFGQSVEAIGDTLGPIDSMRGPFVFELLGIQPARASAFAEVREKVEHDLKLQKARELAEATLRDVLKPQQTGATVSFDSAVADVESRLAARAPKSSEPPPKEGAAAGDKYVLVATSDFLGRSDSWLVLADEIPAQRTGFVREALQLGEGKLGMASDRVNSGVSYLMAVVGQKYPDQKEFDAQKQTIVEEELYHKSSEALESWIAEVKKRANPSEPVLELLSALPGWGFARSKL